jgi:ADP-glucose pyrophosphorylase
VGKASIQLLLRVPYQRRYSDQFSVGLRRQVNSFAMVEDSVIMDGGGVRSQCPYPRAIIDKRNVIAENETIGYDLEEDRKRDIP